MWLERDGRLEAVLERNAQAFEDLQIVIRDSATRHEKALQQVDRALDRVDRALEHFEDALRENTQWTRAGTEAIRRMLDRWGEGPTPAS